MLSKYGTTSGRPCRRLSMMVWKMPGATLILTMVCASGVVDWWLLIGLGKVCQQHLEVMEAHQGDAIVCGQNLVSFLPEFCPKARMLPHPHHQCAYITVAFISGLLPVIFREGKFLFCGHFPPLFLIALEWRVGLQTRRTPALTWGLATLHPSPIVTTTQITQVTIVWLSQFGQILPVANTSWGRVIVEQEKFGKGRGGEAEGNNKKVGGWEKKRRGW